VVRTETDPQVRVGADLVEIDRLARLVAKYEIAEERLFTQAERDYCRGKSRRNEHLAARWAAKEAVGKALGTGIGGAVSWQDVEVVTGAGGRPAIRLHGEASRWAERHGLTQLEVSLSHTRELAMAYVVAVVRPPPAPAP
jgi:holo-[acyl-carrier protein] synthase